MAGLRKLRGKYYVRVYLPGGREKLLPTQTGDRKLAEARKRQIEEREFLVKARLADDLGRIITTLQEATSDFLKDCQTRLRPNTVRGYRLALDNLKKCWGDLDLRGITPKHLSIIRGYLLDRVNPTTANINLRAIRAFLNWLVQSEKIERIPGKIALVKIDQELPKFFTPVDTAPCPRRPFDPPVGGLRTRLRLTRTRRRRHVEAWACPGLPVGPPRARATPGGTGPSRPS